MKDDPTLDTWTDPETEARIVALILGEASDFERSELERLMAEQPELAVFHRRMLAMTALVREAGKPSEEKWKFSPARREVLQRQLGAVPPPVLPKSQKRKPPTRGLVWLAAAGIVMGLGLPSVFLLSIGRGGKYAATAKIRAPRDTTDWKISEPIQEQLADQEQSVEAAREKMVEVAARNGITESAPLSNPSTVTGKPVTGSDAILGPAMRERHERESQLAQRPTSPPAPAPALPPPPAEPPTSTPLFSDTFDAPGAVEPPSGIDLAGGSDFKVKLGGARPALDTPDSQPPAGSAPAGPVVGNGRGFTEGDANETPPSELEARGGLAAAPTTSPVPSKPASQGRDEAPQALAEAGEASRAERLGTFGRSTEAKQDQTKSSDDYSKILRTDRFNSAARRGAEADSEPLAAEPNSEVGKKSQELAATTTNLAKEQERLAELKQQLAKASVDLKMPVSPIVVHEAATVAEVSPFTRLFREKDVLGEEASRPAVSDDFDTGRSDTINGVDADDLATQPAQQGGAGGFGGGGQGQAGAVDQRRVAYSQTEAIHSNAKETLAKDLDRYVAGRKPTDQAQDHPVSAETSNASRSEKAKLASVSDKKEAAPQDGERAEGGQSPGTGEVSLAEQEVIRRQSRVVEADESALIQQLREQEAKVDQARLRMLDIAERYRITDLAALRNTGDPVTGSGAILSKAMLDRYDQPSSVAQIKTQIDTLKELKGDEMLKTAAMLDLKDSTITEFYPQWNRAKLELRALEESGLGKDHPKVRAAEDIVAKTQGILHEAMANVKSSLERKYEMASKALANASLIENQKIDDTQTERSKNAEYAEASKEYKIQKNLLERMWAMAKSADSAAPEETHPAELSPETLRTVDLARAALELPKQSREFPTLTLESSPLHDSIALTNTPEVMGFEGFGDRSNGKTPSDRDNPIRFWADDATTKVNPDQGLAQPPWHFGLVPETEPNARFGNDPAKKEDATVEKSGEVKAALDQARNMEAQAQTDFVRLQVDEFAKSAPDEQRNRVAVQREKLAKAEAVLSGLQSQLRKVPALEQENEIPSKADDSAANHRSELEIAALEEDLARERGLLEQMEAQLAKSTPLAPEPTAEIQASAEPFSTFSLHVSDVSFQLAHAALVEKGQWPEAEKIRAEEFVNAFDYRDPMPTAAEKVGCRIEQSAHPFLPQRNALRVSMRTACEGRAGSQALRLTLLLDTSGSMQREDRRETVNRAVRALSSMVGGRDLISVVSFSRTPRLVTDRQQGAANLDLPAQVAGIPSEGGTNLEEGLRLAEQVALRQLQPGDQNRIVLFTDGAANLGDAQPESLRAKIVALRQQGISFDAVGVGLEGLNDAVLEALTRCGDGRYFALNRPEEAEEGFAKKLAGALRPAARNVKVQLRFEPKRVGAYRLIGFEKHRLNKEDFRNDAVDAAELAAEEAGVALYQVEVKPDGEGDIGEVFVRFQDTATGQMIERSWPIPYDPQTPAFDQAKPTLQLACAAGFLAERLRSGPGKDVVPVDPFPAALNRIRGEFSAQGHFQRLTAMWEKARR